MVERYGVKVSFDRPVYQIAPGAREDEARGTLARLGDLPRALRLALLRSESDEAASLPAAEALELLQNRTPIVSAQVGFESGLFVLFPGLDMPSPGFDARRRPWYVAARDREGEVWSPPYPSPTGAYLVACSTAIRRPDGGLLGVACATIPLDTVLERVGLSALAHVRGFGLVTRDGEVLASQAEKGARVEGGLTGGATKATRRLGVPEVEARLRGGERIGVHRAGDDLFVFSRLQAIDCALVVGLGAAAIDGPGAP